MSEGSTGDNKARVSAVRLSTYEPAAVEKAMEQSLEPFGGMKAFVRPSSPVVLKPNFLSPRDAQRAVCTHPEIIRAAARIALKAGACEVTATDSPAVASARHCARRLGLKDDDVLNVVDADDGIDMGGSDAKYRRLTLSRRMVEANPLINLAKAKTHGQTVLTGAVKNSFGAVVGLEKAQWHFRIGSDPMAFARLLVHIHSLVAPRLNILDAVVGMEGNGPGSGAPRAFNFLLASTDAHALDAVMARIFGLEPENVFTLAAAREAGLLGPVDEIEVVGEKIDDLKLSSPIRPARPAPANLLLKSKRFSRLADRLMSLSPKVEFEKCTACGQCAEVCAAGAIEVNRKARRPRMRMTIDDNKCISCFCCQELCPEGAISVKTGIAARILSLGARKPDERR